MNPVTLFQLWTNLFGRLVKQTAIFLTFVLWLCGIIKTCVAAVLASFAAMFAALDISAFKGISFATLEYIGYVNAILPLSEFVGLLSIYLTAWGIVILIRWTKSFIPAIAN